MCCYGSAEGEKHGFGICLDLKVAFCLRLPFVKLKSKATNMIASIGATTLLSFGIYLD
ncbi:hypothetical protein TSUD_274970 [Trifolium subterraneum]|uniref:Uncharacterized protein n=1 Tax=Trifolium subterraneum TaxID=3900 RepID=A0A2Z6NCB1_TRISU|nr:hypothetical protein TSUD_274970 [Trifolium subterraneum]